MFATRSTCRWLRPIFRHLKQDTNLNIQRRTLVRAPKPGDGPLMERRPDRELPHISTLTFRWSRTLPIFCAIIAAASFAMFNYQKSSSSVVASTLYCLRTNPTARDVLGDEIYFAAAIPWIRGSINQMQGRIDISFRVKGTKGEATMRFASFRPGRRAMFQTTDWYLELDGGEKVELLDGQDPFVGIVSAGDAVLNEEERAQTKGFRQQIK